MANQEYKPIPVEAAKQIAETYKKNMVVIMAYDNVHEQIHTTTYGVSPEDKNLAAVWGELFTAITGADVVKSTWYEDYRTTKEAEWKAEKDRLERELLASRAAHRSAWCLYETEKSARQMAEHERDKMQQRITELEHEAERK